MANQRVITRKDFEAYEKVRKSMKYDMLLSEARIATGLSEDHYLAIRIHYRQLADDYKNNTNKDILLNHL